MLHWEQGWRKDAHGVGRAPFSQRDDNIDGDYYYYDDDADNYGVMMMMTGIVFPAGNPQFPACP